MIRITWVGFHEEGLMAFRKILEYGYPVNGFITLSEASFLKRSAGSRDYAQLCKDHQVPYFAVDTIKGDEAYEIIYEQAPDLLVVLGWSEILPERLLKIPTIGTIGTHAALLPHNRGSAPINWALIHGEDKTGNTMMWLDPEVDAGAIIDQMGFEISLYDTCKTLYDKVAETNAVMLLKLLDNLEKGIKPVSQIANETDEAILPRRRPKDGLINWNQSGKAVYDFIRALTDPYPGAYTFLNTHKWIIWKASLLPTKTEAEPGTIIGTSYGFSDNTCGYVVATEDNAILVTEIEAEDGKRYTGPELNNLRLEGKVQDE